MSRTLHEDLIKIILLPAVENIVYVNKTNKTHCCLSMETVLCCWQHASQSTRGMYCCFLWQEWQCERCYVALCVYSLSFSLCQHHSTNASRLSVIQSMARALRDCSFLVIKSHPTKRIKHVRYEDNFVYCTCQEFNFSSSTLGCVFFFDHYFKFKTSFLYNPAHPFDITKCRLILCSFLLKFKLVVSTPPQETSHTYVIPTVSQGGSSLC
jgi:hypothetical protein